MNDNLTNKQRFYDNPYRVKEISVKQRLVCFIKSLLGTPDEQLKILPANTKKRFVIVKLLNGTTKFNNGCEHTHYWTKKTIKKELKRQERLGRTIGEEIYVKAMNAKGGWEWATQAPKQMY